jgi:hypothetical protein
MVAEKLYLPKIRTFLQGKKTYLLLALYVLSNSHELMFAIQQLADSKIDLVTFLSQVQQIVLAFSAMTAKAAIDRNGGKIVQISKEQNQNPK